MVFIMQVITNLLYSAAVSDSQANEAPSRSGGIRMGKAG